MTNKVTSGAEPALNSDVDAVRAMLNEAPLPQMTSASVRVMRSHDYCHFEVILGVQGAPIIDAQTMAADPNVARAPLTIADVDWTRKAAARLVEKAIEQFKIAKQNAEDLLREELDRGYAQDRYDRALAQPEDERTPEQKATIKAFEDNAYRASRRYDYEDDWRDEDPED